MTLTWIKHKPGPMPVDGDTTVWVRFRADGDCEAFDYAQPASDLGRSWSDGSITHYCVIPEPVMPGEEPEPIAKQPVKTLRDEFAMAALAGLCSSILQGSKHTPDEIAWLAGQIADAMMKERGDD